MSSNASDLFIKALENEGVEYIHGIPGEENLDLLEAIRKSNIKLIINRHEQAAAFMAATHGRLTGKPGVAISTLGPGATNFSTAAAYATLGGFPLILITGQKPIKKSKQGRFQIIDVVSMMKPITKYSKQIVDANMITSTIREAFQIATSEKPGAVHIEFPEDVSAEMVTSDTRGVFNIPKVYSAMPDDNAIQELASLIESAKMPLLLLGSACSRTYSSTSDDLADTVTNLVNNIGIPTFCTQMAKGVLSENNQYFIGTAALSDYDYLHETIKKSDLIINVGHDIIEKPPYFVDGNHKFKVVHVNYYKSDADNVYNSDLEIIGDIGVSLSKLSKVAKKCTQDFSFAYKMKELYYKNSESVGVSSSFPMPPQRIVKEISELMKEDGIVHLDNGMYKLWFARNYKVMSPNLLLLDNALATMGAGLPGAMEAARIYPNKKVLAVLGDGGFMMNSQELETAIRMKLNLTVLILNDSSYGMIKWKQTDMGLSDYGLDFGNPDFVKYAESYGAKGYRVCKSEEFKPILSSCLNDKGVHLIDLPIDYSENKKFFTNELKNKKV